MNRTIYYEFRRLASPRHTLLGILLIVTSLYLAASGALHYRRLMEEKRGFSEYESRKVSQYVNYEQYGGLGLRIMYLPPPLSLFFESRPVTISRIDTSEIIEINNRFKGKSFFSRSGYFKGFADFTLFFGTLLMIHMGLTAFRGKKGAAFFQYRRRIGIIAFSRWLILQFFFILLFTAAYAVPRLLGIGFSSRDTLGYLLYCGYTSLVLGSFYAAGLLVLFKKLSNRNALFKTGWIIWLLWVIIIPNTFREVVAFGANRITPIETVNVEKLKTAMTFERNARSHFSGMETADNKTKQRLARRLVNRYMQTGVKRNKAIEERLMRQVEQLGASIARFSILFPTTSWEWLGESLAGRGLEHYSQYNAAICGLRDNFYKFYIQKRYYNQSEDIESFITGDENIFHSRSSLPRNFLAALAVTLAFLLALLLMFRQASHPRFSDHYRRISEFPLDDLQKGNSYFVFCKNDTVKEHLFHTLAESRTIAAIDQMEAEDISMDLPPGHLLDYLCLHRKITDPSRAATFLSCLLAENAANVPRRPRAGSLIKKIYCAVILSQTRDTIVINDFLKGMSKSFERSFIDLLTGPRFQNKLIVYLSSEMYMSSAYIENQLEDGEKLEIYQVDIRKVSLR